jgi:lysophospholipase L1-like esterase
LLSVLVACASEGELPEVSGASGGAPSAGASGSAGGPAAGTSGHAGSGAAGLAGSGQSGSAGSASGASGEGGAGSGGVSATGGAAGGGSGGLASGAGGGGSGGVAGEAGSTASGGSSAGAAGASSGTGGAGSAGRAGASGGGAGGSGGELGPITIWIAGDSTVATGSAACPHGWGGRFDVLFDDRVTVTNSAVGGRSVRTWMYNVQTVMGDDGECVLTTDQNGEPTLQARFQTMLSGMKQGDYLFVQFGINDGSATCDRHVGIEAFKDSYGVLADAAKSRGAEPIFVTPVSAVACNGSTARGTRGSYVDATIDAGTEFDVPVIDLHALSVELYQSLGFCPIPGGDVSASTAGPVGEFFCDDHTHFDTPGAVRIAEVVAQALRDQEIGLAAYLK